MFESKRQDLIQALEDAHMRHARWENMKKRLYEKKHELLKEYLKTIKDIEEEYFMQKPPVNDIKNAEDALLKFIKETVVH